VYSLLSQREVPVPNVDDKRQVDADFDFEFDEEDTDDIDQMIEEQLSDLSLSPLSAEAEDLVRDESIDDDDIRTEMNHRIRAAQEEEFREATLEER
jgi:hypothetical protein